MNFPSQSSCPGNLLLLLLLSWPICPGRDPIGKFPEKVCILILSSPLPSLISSLLISSAVATHPVDNETILTGNKGVSEPDEGDGYTTLNATRLILRIIRMVDFHCMNFTSKKQKRTILVPLVWKRHAHTQAHTHTPWTPINFRVEAQGSGFLPSSWLQLKW